MAEVRVSEAVYPDGIRSESQAPWATKGPGDGYDQAQQQFILMEPRGVC